MDLVAAMDSKRYMAFEQPQSGVKVLQSLDATESVRVMIDGIIVYDSIGKPDWSWMSLMEEDCFENKINI